MIDCTAGTHALYNVNDQPSQAERGGGRCMTAQKHIQADSGLFPADE